MHVRCDALHTDLTDFVLATQQTYGSAGVVVGSVESYGGRDVEKNPIVLFMLASLYLFAIALAGRDRYVVKMRNMDHCARIWRSQQVLASLSWLHQHHTEIEPMHARLSEEDQTDEQSTPADEVQLPQHSMIVRHIANHSSEGGSTSSARTKRQALLRVTSDQLQEPHVLLGHSASTSESGSWQREKERALEIEKFRASALAQVTDQNQKVNFTASRGRFVHALMQENALLAMIAPGRPSPERAAVMLLRLVSFPAAIALLVGGWGQDDFFYDKWSVALQNGEMAVIALCLRSFMETVCIALSFTPMYLALAAALRVNGDVLRLQELSDIKLEADGLPQIDTRSNISIIDVSRALLITEVQSSKHTSLRTCG